MLFSYSLKKKILTVWKGKITLIILGAIESTVIALTKSSSFRGIDWNPIDFGNQCIWRSDHHKNCIIGIVDEYFARLDQFNVPSIWVLIVIFIVDGGIHNSEVVVSTANSSTEYVWRCAVSEPDALELEDEKFLIRTTK
jgi:hypothetical protein